MELQEGLLILCGIVFTSSPLRFREQHGNGNLAVSLAIKHYLGRIKSHKIDQYQKKKSLVYIPNSAHQHLFFCWDSHMVNVGVRACVHLVFFSGRKMTPPPFWKSSDFQQHVEAFGVAAQQNRSALKKDAWYSALSLVWLHSLSPHWEKFKKDASTPHRLNDPQCHRNTESLREEEMERAKKWEGSVRVESLLLSRCDLIRQKKCRGQGTLKRRAPFGPCSPSLFTTVTLTSESNTFFFTPCTSAKPEAMTRYHRAVCGSCLCQIRVPPNCSIILHCSSTVLGVTQLQK